MALLSQKEKNLTNILQKLGKIAIAFSGGYDSSFLAKFAEKTLGTKGVILIHVSSVFSPSRDEKSVAKFAKTGNLQLIRIFANPLLNAKIAKNPLNRCYHCKKVIMKQVIQKGQELGFANFADGTNLDDISEHRPGFKATNELGILHPLLEAKISKDDMIKIAHKHDFDLSFTPSSSCLATRIPHGVKLEKKKLKMADNAENILCDFLIPSPRVRIREKTAIIEIPSELFHIVIKNREKILQAFHRVGFQKVHLDLDGYKKKQKNNLLSQSFI